MLLEWSMRTPVPSRPDITTWTSLTDNEATMLRMLATNRHVFEIGTAFGYSMAVMGAVAKSVWTIDYPAKPGWGNYNFPEEPLPGYESTSPVVDRLIHDLGLQQIGIAHGNSHVLLALGNDFGGSLADCQMAFIDGDHSYVGCLDDLINCTRILGTNGILAVHDYAEDSNPEVAKAVDDWCHDSPHHVTIVDTLAVIII